MYLGVDRKTDDQKPKLKRPRPNLKRPGKKWVANFKDRFLFGKFGH
jgi:hypothetical protein